MGQRLNIEILNNGEVLANAYYHWSAYSDSSIELLETILNNINKFKNESDLIVKAIRLLECTGAGLNDAEIQKYDNKDIKFVSCNDRNCGLIAVSKDGIEETRMWEEGRISINIDEETFDYEVIHLYSKSEYNSEREYDKNLKEIKELPVLNLSFYSVPFVEIYNMREIVNTNIELGYFRIPNNNNIFSFIY